MKGKQRCKILKDLRRQIAEQNDITYVTSECKHKGDCMGTCPKCESEVRYLERELEKRVRLGKAVTVVGLAAGITFASAGCAPFDNFWKTKELDGDMLPPSEVSSDAGENSETETSEVDISEDMGDPREIFGDEIDVVTDGEPEREPFLTDENGTVIFFDCPSPEELFTGDDALVTLFMNTVSRAELRELWWSYTTDRSKECDVYIGETLTVSLFYDENGGFSHAECTPRTPAQ